MCRLDVLVLKKHLDAITCALGECGYVHLVDAVTKSRRHLLKQVGRQQDKQELQSCLKLCETLLESLGLKGTSAVTARLSTDTSGGQGLAALPIGGIPSHGDIGRASSFAKATEDKDARPSLVPLAAAEMDVEELCTAIEKIQGEYSTLNDKIQALAAQIDALAAESQALAAFPVQNSSL